MQSKLGQQLCYLLAGLQIKSIILILSRLLFEIYNRRQKNWLLAHHYFDKALEWDQLSIVIWNFCLIGESIFLHLVTHSHLEEK